MEGALVHRNILVKSAQKCVGSRPPRSSLLRRTAGSLPGRGIRSWFAAASRVTDVPPKARQIPEHSIYHGRSRIDEFKWIENLSNPEAIRYWQEEDRYATTQLHKHNNLERRLRKELRQRIPHTPPIALPDVIDDWMYFSRWASGHLQYVRRKLSNEVDEILLDARYLPQRNSVIIKCLVSSDHSRLAYLLCRPTEEQGTLYIRDLGGPSSKAPLSVSKVHNFVWAVDGATLYYTQLDEALRSSKVFRHTIGDQACTDELVYYEQDPAYFVDVNTTKDKKYVLINCSKAKVSEVLLVDTSITAPLHAVPQVVILRTVGLEYYVDHHEDTFFILHSTESKNRTFSLSLLDKGKIGHAIIADLVPVIAAAPDEKIEEVELFKGFAALFMKKAGLPKIVCHDFRARIQHEVQLPEEICSVTPGTNVGYNTSVIRFQTSSPTNMQAVYEYDMAMRALRLCGERNASGLEKGKYVVERIAVPGAGGVDIPVTLIRSKALQLNGRNPVNIRAYGAYGVPLEPHFRLDLLPLLSRGFLIALAHVRGGSELGSSWYDEGRMLHKLNSVLDVEAVADHLIEKGYTQPSLITGHGISAGGLLMGAVINRRPSLFRAVVLRMPFLDPLSAMLDKNAALTSVEHDEWGDPIESASVYDYMSSYAPYDAIPIEADVGKKFSTSILITTALEDQRVEMWQALKYVARMRARNPSIFSGQGQSSARLLLKVLSERAHNAVTEAQKIQEASTECAFFINEIDRG
ncbi:hypothetical protein HDU85_000836 [Gaertneriomyces sp. JEL0708]|nr:hypothetical protein HDU85_000836 [Gaertneriomyces sp. JEL0708]